MKKIQISKQKTDQGHQLPTYWYLGLLGLIGLYELPEVWAYLFKGIGSAWSLTNLLWLLWFSYFFNDTKD